MIRTMFLLIILAVAAISAIGWSSPTLGDYIRVYREDNGAEMYPRFTAGINHYNVRCNPDHPLIIDAMTVTDGGITVNGISFWGDGVRLEYMPGGLDDLITIETDGGVYYVQCVSDRFPIIDVTKTEGASEGLWLTALDLERAGDGRSYLIIADTNGVVHWWKDIKSWVTHFKYFEGLTHPYAYPQRDNAWFIMNDDLEVVDALRAWKKFNTDKHDLALPDDDSQVTISYEKSPPHTWALGPDALRNTYPNATGMIHSIIQWSDRSPHDYSGIRWEWHSWHEMKHDNCVYYYDRDGYVDYAHANSVEIVDGNVLVSFRQCSMVIMIDGETGETLWRVGYSFHDDDGWIDDGFKPPMRIVGDPQVSFCGPHSAKILSNGNLLLYDNGVLCGDDAHYSRVVEYELDIEAQTATYVREYPFYWTERDFQTRIRGLVEVLGNGNWFISWGGWIQPIEGGTLEYSPVPEMTISEVNPDTGEHLMDIHIHAGGAAWDPWYGRLGVRAYWIGDRLP